MFDKEFSPSNSPTRVPRYPEIIEGDSSSLLVFMQDCHQLCMIILSAIEKELGVQDALQTKHEFFDMSGDHVRLTRGPARVGQDPEIQTPSHTDFGTATLLFNWLGGLQWQDPDDYTWKWIAPKPGHLLVNMGDAASIFTGGMCKAARHRVVPAPGEQGKHPRYSLAYFLRPGNLVMLQELKASSIPQGQQLARTVMTAERWTANQARELGIGRQVFGRDGKPRPRLAAPEEI